MRTLLPFALAGLLMASPEITAAVSRAGGLSGAVIEARRITLGVSPPKPLPSLLSSRAPFSSGPPRRPGGASSAVVVTKKLRLVGVKCAACGERARAAAAVAAAPFGADVSVDWLKREATVKIPAGAGGKRGLGEEEKAKSDSVLSGVIMALGEAGFGAADVEEES